jgi:hypothetical protein
LPSDLRPAFGSTCGDKIRVRDLEILVGIQLELSAPHRRQAKIVSAVIQSVNLGEAQEEGFDDNRRDSVKGGQPHPGLAGHKGTQTRPNCRERDDPLKEPKGYLLPKEEPHGESPTGPFEQLWSGMDLRSCLGAAGPGRC